MGSYMSINIIASSSAGNCIVIEDSGSKIILDCGLPYRKLSRFVSFSEADAVLLTHSHMDHAQASEELLRRGYKVYMSLGTADALGFGGSIMNGLLVKHLNHLEIGAWKVLPFDVIHDAPEPLGFLIQHKESKKKYVYLVDSAVISYSFTGVNYWLIEANYSDVLIDKQSGIHPALKRRIQENHFSIEDLIRFFTEKDKITGKPIQDLSKTEEIHLLHLSKTNSNAQKFIDRLQAQTGIPVYTTPKKKYQ